MKDWQIILCYPFMIVLLLVSVIAILFPPKVQSLEFVKVPQQELTFKPEVKNISTWLETGINKTIFKEDAGYKEERARYAYNYAKEERQFTHEQAMYMVVQLHIENGTWDENRRGDAGCSVGLSQWNECARGEVPYKDWQGQIRMMIDEIATKMHFTTFDMARVSWNKPAVLKTGQYKTVYYYKIEQHKDLFNL